MEFKSKSEISKLTKESGIKQIEVPENFFNPITINVLRAILKSDHMKQFKDCESYQVLKEHIEYLELPNE